MKCPECQHQNPEGARFCNQCGVRLPAFCPSYAGANPPGAKFCNECGYKLDGTSIRAEAVPLGASPPPSLDLAGQRRRVAVLFADVSGSTALGEKYDAEVVFEVMNQCFNGLAGIITRHEGHVLKYIGDCVMALFGAPVAHGDDPQRTVRAGLEMQVWLAQFSEELQRRHGLPFRMRVGINFGTVVAGGVGSENRMEYDVLGDAVNVAQRLEAAAEPGSVYVSETVERLARGAVEFESMGLVQVKGRAQGVQVFRALRERVTGDAGGAETRPEALVGRAESVEQLRSLVASVAEGAGRFLALSGEPGIGKTALLEKSADLARERHFSVHLLSGAERQVHDPLGVPRHWLREVIGAPAGFVESAAAIRELGPGVAPYAAELALLLHPGASEAPSGLDPETRLRLQVLGMVALARDVAEKAPLLLAIDDVQWLDPASQAVVQALAESSLRGELNGVALLVAYRAGTPPVWVADSSIAECVHPVRALEFPACLELMRQWVRPEDLPESVVEQIVQRSGGHPHYLVELLRHLVETEQIRLESGRWRYYSAATGETLPDTLYGAVAARLDRLEAPQRAAVQCAAPVGQQFPVWLVRELEPAVAWDGALPELEALQFLEQPVYEPLPEYRFKQAVVREVAYESILQGRRRQLHARIAELLEANTPAAETASTLAWHLERAEQWERAAHWHREAGYWAGESYINEDAMEHYRKCLTLLDAGGGADELLRFRARRGLGDIAMRLGNHESAIREYEACLGTPSGATISQLAAVQCQLGRCRHELGAAAQAEVEWRGAFRRLSGLTDSEAGRVRANILSEWGFAEYRSGRYRRALRLGSLSHAQAVAAGALLEQGDAANLRALAYQERGEVESAITWYQETLSIAERTGDAAALATVRNNLGTLWFSQGRLREAEASYQAAEAHWLRMGDRAQTATCLLNLGNVALARGHFEVAYESLQGAARAFEEIGQPYGAAAARATLGEVCIGIAIQGQEIAARLTEAETAFSEAASQARTLDAPDLEAYAALGLAEMALRRSSILPHLADVIEEEARLEYAAELIREHELVSMRGHERRLRGEMLAKWGDKAQAIGVLETALAHFEAMEAHQEVGRTLLALAELRADRSELLKRAAEIFRQCGAEGDLERVELAAAKDRLPAGDQ